MNMISTPIEGRNIHCKDGSLYPFIHLHKEIEKVVPTVEHRWEKDDLLIWDNFQVMHRSMGGYGNNRRQLWRA
jgi:taurine dioxygenase